MMRASDGGSPVKARGRTGPGVAGRARDAGRFVLHGAKVLVRGGYGLARMARGGELRSALRPWMRFELMEDVPFDLLAGQGVRAVLFDLENTLVPPGGPFTDDGVDAVRRARAAGLKVGVVSNASAAWVAKVLAERGIPFVAPASKPAPRAFVEACRKLGERPSRVAFIGDQMITDVFGAQRAGIRAILLEPRFEREALSSRFQRLVSRGLLRVVGR